MSTVKFDFTYEDIVNEEVRHGFIPILINAYNKTNRKERFGQWINNNTDLFVIADKLKLMAINDGKLTHDEIEYIDALDKFYNEGNYDKAVKMLYSLSPVPVNNVKLQPMLTNEQRAEGMALMELRLDHKHLFDKGPLKVSVTCQDE